MANPEKAGKQKKLKKNKKSSTKDTLMYSLVYDYEMEKWVIKCKKD